MKFSFLAEVFSQIEKEPSRLAMTKLLADVLGKATPKEAAIITYLSLGSLYPSYIGTKFNFAEKSMYKVVALLLDTSVETVIKKTKKLGDIGLVIESSERIFSGEAILTIQQVDKALKSVLEISGTGSQDIKEKELFELLSQLDNISAKYIVRIVLGNLRLGFSDMTLLDAFSWMQEGDKSLRKKLEDAYNTSADIGLLITILKEDGIKKIENMGIVPGVPIRPAAAERLASASAILEKIGPCVAQPKLDGFRVQVHVFTDNKKRVVKFFSRNLQDMSEMFPELSQEAIKLSKKDFVAEGEAIAYDAETGVFLPFQETVKRRRKYGIESMSVDVPLKLFLFDLLYENGESLLNNTHAERRKKLLSLFKNKQESIIAPLEEIYVKTAKELEDYFAQNISSGLEGLVVKREDSVYQPGKRNFNWIKLKRQEAGQLDDTIDCVILGYYAGHGKRANFGIGAFLVGVFNKDEDRFETIAKIGTGLSDQEWRDQKKKCDEIAVNFQPKNVECAKELKPDVWVSPEIVCLIRADEITLSPLHSAGATNTHQGFALRFPRIMGYRPDKSAKDATDVKEIERLYEIQFEGRERKQKKGQKNVAGQKTIF